MKDERLFPISLRINKLVELGVGSLLMNNDIVLEVDISSKSFKLFLFLAGIGGGSGNRLRKVEHFLEFSVVEEVVQVDPGLHFQNLGVSSSSSHSDVRIKERSEVGEDTESTDSNQERSSVLEVAESDGSVSVARTLVATKLLNGNSIGVDNLHLLHVERVHL